MLRLLSYPVDPATPSFMHYPEPRMYPVQQMERRQNVNTSMYELFSNTGTHMIAPLHVHPNGYDIAALPPEKFRYERPVVIDVQLPQTWLIGEGELSPHAEAIGSADLLLVRTGFSAKRTEDPELYGAGNPGFDVSAAMFLIEKFPDLKAVGMDFPYPSSAHHLSRGLAFQQVILGSADPERYILLLADLDLSGDLTGLREVWALPLRVSGGPSAPCTVIARLEEPGESDAAPADENGAADESEAAGGKTDGEETA